MAWIQTLGEADDRTLARLFGDIKARRGFVPHMLQVFSLRPEVLERLLGFLEVAFRGGTSLGRRREEMIAYYVSAVNTCRY